GPPPPPPPLPLLQPQGVLLLVPCVALGQRIRAGGCSRAARWHTRRAHRSAQYGIPDTGTQRGKQPRSRPGSAAQDRRRGAVGAPADLDRRREQVLDLVVGGGQEGRAEAPRE